MSDGFAIPRGEFRAPRIPFDLRCIILAAAGYLALFGIDRLLGGLWDLHSPTPLGHLFAMLAAPLDRIPFLGAAFRKATTAIWGVPVAGTLAALVWWKALITAALFFGVWSLFGSALLRTAALRLTRDEPISLREALGFGAKNWWTFFRAPILVAAFAAFFVLCNMLAGFVMSLHFVGSSLIALVAFPLALISSLLIVISLAGGLIGLPLIWAGVAVEQNGALEAISRAFSYVFARPFRFFFGYFLIFVLMAVVMIVGDYFQTTVKETLKAGVVRESLDRAISYERNTDGDALDYGQSPKGEREAEGIRNLANIGEVRWFDWIGFFWMWLFLWIFLLGFKGFAVYVFLGGTASLYLHLRQDVDGTDEEEIYPESDEEFEASAEGSEPRWVNEEGEASAPADAPPADETVEGNGAGSDSSSSS